VICASNQFSGQLDCPIVYGYGTDRAGRVSGSASGFSNVHRAAEGEGPQHPCRGPSRAYEAVTVEYSDSASFSCPELKRLRELYHDAWAAFRQADEAMHQGVGVTTKENSAGLTAAWDRARLAYETAAAALESHQATHGCSSQRNPGTLIHRGRGSGRA